MRVHAVVKRQVESNSHGPDYLHFETSKDNVHLA